MTRNRAIPRMVALAGIVLLALGLPACSSSGCASLPWLTNRYPDSTNVVQRPTYEPDTGKPFFLGGYAGANYDPIFRRRRILNDGETAPVASQPTLSIDQGAWDPD